MKNLNLTPRAQKLIKEAYKIAVDYKHAEITHLHLFISFLNAFKILLFDVKTKIFE